MSNTNIPITTTTSQPQPIRKRSTASHHVSSSGSIEINTCCGSVSMTHTKCLTMAVLILNIVTFCALLALLINVYIAKIDQNIDSITKRGEAFLYSEILSCSSRIAASSRNDNVTKFFVQRYDEYHPKYMSLMNEIMEMVPSSVVGEIQSETNEVNNITRDEVILMEEEAIRLVKEGQKDDALEILDGEEYTHEKIDYDEDLTGYTDYLRNLEMKKNEFTNARTLGCLILVCCLMVLVLPIVFISLISSFSREKIECAKLERAKAIVLNDTMADPKLKELFKKHCEQEFSIENFLLLERINEYKQLCEKSFEIQIFLYDSSSDEVSTNSANTNKTANSTTSTSISNYTNNKKISYTEKDLENVEKQKRELAQNIYDQFLNINGVMPVNVNKKVSDDILKEIHTSGLVDEGNVSILTNLEMNSDRGTIQTLSESLFDFLESETQIVMMDTHTRFKQSIAFQKKMKIDNIKQKMTINKKR